MNSGQDGHPVGDRQVDAPRPEPLAVDDACEADFSAVRISSLLKKPAKSRKVPGQHRPPAAEEVQQVYGILCRRPLNRGRYDDAPHGVHHAPPRRGTAAPLKNACVNRWNIATTHRELRRVAWTPAPRAMDM